LRHYPYRLRGWKLTNVAAILFGVLRKRYWGQHLWGRGYWVTSSGNVTDEVWAEYIKNQTPPEPDDDFNVT
jgi:putative transposase